MEQVPVSKRGRLSKEDSVIASFSIGKYNCSYDGNCWTTETDDASKQYFHSTLEGVCNSLLNKITSSKLEDLKSVVYEIRKAKQDILDVVKFVDKRLETEES